MVEKHGIGEQFVHRLLDQNVRPYPSNKVVLPDLGWIRMVRGEELDVVAGVSKEKRWIPVDITC